MIKKIKKTSYRLRYCKKCNFSTANELVDENRRKAENKTEIKVLISFIISSLIIIIIIYFYTGR